MRELSELSSMIVVRIMVSFSILCWNLNYPYFQFSENIFDFLNRNNGVFKTKHFLLELCKLDLTIKLSSIHRNKF